MEIVSRSSAASLGLKEYFTGKPCKRGHISPRYILASNCKECMRTAYTERNQRYYLENKGNFRKHWDRSNEKSKHKRSEARKVWLKERLEALKAKGKAPGEESHKVLVAGRRRPDICELCGEKGPIVFDHCHQTGEFRGWICKRCNTVLGLVHDSPCLLGKLTRYLQSSREEVA